MTLSKARIALQESHLAALKTFYAVLTPEQKAVFDQHAWPAGHGRRHAAHHRAAQ
ncbi:MAG: Spy/CpxP family protein refolding chaperone [Pseudomonadota bacterium]